MGEAFISRRGGKATAYAVIGVTFPSGSTVTCVKNSVSLKANGSGTNMYFDVPEAGAWVVTITGGGKTKSQTVTISAAGQVEKIALDYGLTLFDNGTGKESWSAAVHSYSGGTATVGTVLHFQEGSGSAIFGNPQGWIYTTQALSFSGRSSLTVVASTSFSGSLPTAGHAQVRIVEEHEEFSSFSPTLAADLTVGNGETTTVNVSGLDNTKKYRVVLYASGGYFDDQQGGVTRLATTVDVTSVTAT